MRTAMTLQDDSFMEDEEENTSTKLYLLTWYIALHFDDWVSGKIGSGLLPDAHEGTPDIVNAHGQEGSATPVSLAWELKTGGLTTLDSSGHIGTTWLADEAASIRRAQAQLKRAANEGFVPGNLSNDPKIEAFFLACGKPLCQVDLPDGTQLMIKYPTVNGVLIYRISGSTFKLEPDPGDGDPAFSLDNQSSEAAKRSFKSIKSWIEDGWVPRPVGIESLYEK